MKKLNEFNQQAPGKHHPGAKIFLPMKQLLTILFLAFAFSMQAQGTQKPSGDTLQLNEAKPYAIMVGIAKHPTNEFGTAVSFLPTKEGNFMYFFTETYATHEEARQRVAQIEGLIDRHTGKQIFSNLQIIKLQ